MILCSGAFDGLHSGHIAYIEAAQQLNPNMPVCVAVAPDSYIRSTKKREPRWNQRQRLVTVRALRTVHSVVEQRASSVAEVIREKRPNLFVKGVDWVGKIPADIIQACVETGCLVVFVDAAGTHTSEVDWQAIGEAL